jgi:hypothetical protein
MYRIAYQHHIGLAHAITLLALAAAFCISRPAHSEKFTVLGYDSNCSGLKLKGASGIPGTRLHQYKFVGTCNITNNRPEVERTVPAVAEARWDGTKLEFQESFKLLGDVNYSGGTITSGSVATIFKCNDDPLISNAACVVVHHKNSSGFPPFSNPAVQQHRPLLRGKTTLAEATALSKQNMAGKEDHSCDTGPQGRRWQCPAQGYRRATPGTSPGARTHNATPAGTTPAMKPLARLALF